jgi:cell fate (sporulation/competence/biofilm development) regulator YlbF (YheA/YmcA/DUF963 family)
MITRPKPNMEEITAKTEELCTTILEQSSFQELKQMINDFITNDSAIAQYNNVMETQKTLQQKQLHGIPLTPDEIDSFEKDREQLFVNPVTRDFMYAQQEFTKIQDIVNKYVVKTIELDRLPTEEDLDDGGCGCGGNCGCGGH